MRCAGVQRSSSCEPRTPTQKTSPAWARDIAQVIENNGKSDSVAFVIDDRVDVVWQARHKGIKVDGVHIGQTDLEPQEARALLGEDAIVGLSARNRKAW